MFESPSKLIQFNIWFKFISWKFNSKDYSIQNQLLWFSSIKYSILDILIPLLPHDQTWIYHVSLNLSIKRNQGIMMHIRQSIMIKCTVENKQTCCVIRLDSLQINYFSNFMIFFPFFGEIQFKKLFICQFFDRIQFKYLFNFQFFDKIQFKYLFIFQFSTQFNSKFDSFVRISSLLSHSWVLQAIN